VLDPANTSRDILADKGYVDGEREARLSQGWRMHIQRKDSKGKPISAEVMLCGSLAMPGW